MRNTHALWVTSMVLAAVGGVTHAQSISSQPLRDPTQPPAAARLQERADGVDDVQAPQAPRHIVLKNGRAYVVDRGRRLSIGDFLGTARIERVDGSAVWLREDGVLRQVPLYGGVRKRPVVPSDSSKVKPSHFPHSKSKDKQS